MRELLESKSPKRCSPVLKTTGIQGNKKIRPGFVTLFSRSPKSTDTRISASYRLQILPLRSRVPGGLHINSVAVLQFKANANEKKTPTLVPLSKLDKSSMNIIVTVVVCLHVGSSV